MNIKTKPAEIIWDDPDFSIDLVALTGHKKMNLIWGSGTGISMRSMNLVPGNVIYTTNTTQLNQMNQYMHQNYGIASNTFGGLSAAQGQQANIQALQNVYQSTPTPQSTPNPPKSWVKWWK